MCFVSDEMNRKRLVIVTAYGPEGIYAYNVDTNSPEWRKEIDGMEKAYVVSDGHRHLFVCDGRNECIHTLSVADGKYMGCLVKRGEQGLGRTCWAVWSEEMSSLIVAHTRDGK